MDERKILESIFSPSGNVVARKIEGETIIIPIVAGIGDLEDDLYALNETGQLIWEKLDGHKSVMAIIEELKADFSAPGETIREDVVGIIEELARRRIIVGA